MVRLFSQLSLLVAIILASGVRPMIGIAQSAGPVVDESLTHWTLADGMLYWADICPGGEFVGPGYLRRMPANGGTERTLATTTRDNCGNFISMVADTTGIYYYNGVDGGIYFRPTNDPFDPPHPVLLPAESPAIGTNLVLAGDTIYWLTGSGKILRVERDGTGLEEFVVGIPGARDLLIVGGGAYWLDDSGLWQASLTCTPLPCATTVRKEQANGHHLMYVQTGATRVVRFDNFIWTEYGSPERIRRVSCGTIVAFCDTTTFYTAPANDVYLGEPTTDGTNVFWTEAFRIPGEVPDGRLQRKPLAGGDAAEIVTNVPFFAQELEIDSLFVYYHIYAGSTQSPGIYRIALNAAAIVRDLAADALEVTQAIQSLANDTPLVARKPTFVRGYGRADSGLAARSVDAGLYGERNGVPLPGSPLRPTNGVLGLTAGTIYDRSKVNESWLFKLPASWTAAGNITLRLVVDPRAAYSDTTRANNELTLAASFGATGPVCTIFVPIRTDAPEASTSSPNFWPMVDLAKRLWPTHDYWTYRSGSGLEELQACWAGPFPYPCGGPFELPDDTWKVFLGIGTIDVFTDDPDECQDAGGSIHYVGMVHPDTGTDGVLGTGMTSVFNYSWVKFPNTKPLSPLDFSDPNAGATLAHELAHNKSRQHVDCGGPDDPDPNYPYPGGYLDLIGQGQAGHYGFDPRTRRVIPPSGAKDFMSYCDPEWTSDYTWKALYGSLSGVATTASARVAGADLVAATDVVMVTGAVTPTENIGELGYAYKFPTATLGAGLLRKWQSHTAAAGQATGTRAAISDTVVAANYHVRLLDAAGAVLADQPVTPVEPELEGLPSLVLPFIATFPAPAGTVAKLELLQDSIVIDSRTPGPDAPTVQISKPAGGETVDDTLDLNWSAGDANPDDILRYAVQYSPDGGATWQAIFSDFIGPREPKIVNLTIDALSLQGSTPDGGRIRVAASDGYNTGIAISQPFTVADRKPEPFIVDPAPGASAAAGQAIPLRGDATDVEDGGLSEAALHWSVGGAAVGAGEELNLEGGLAPGTYAVELTARDSLPQTATATATLNILPLNVPAGEAPILDGFCDDAGYAGATLAPLAAYDDDTGASVRLIRDSSALWACFSGLQGGAPTSEASVGLRVDRDFSRDALAQSDDYGFFVGEDGGVSTVQGDGTGAFAAPGPGGLTAQVSSNGPVWTAELRVDATTLNGFGHYVGLELGHYGVGTAVDNYRWPFASILNQPASWAKTALGDTATITALDPAVATAGSPSVTLTISGTGFISTTVARFDGASLPTTVISPTLLSATVGADKLTAARTLPVVVRNAGELDSNPLPFQVRNPQPVITSLSPNTAAAEGPAFTLTVNGTGFRDGAQVYWDGEPLATAFQDEGRLTAQVDAARIFQGQTAGITVVNPEPSNGAATPASFEVTPTAGPPDLRIYVPLVRR